MSGRILKKTNSVTVGAILVVRNDIVCLSAGSMYVCMYVCV